MDYGSGYKCGRIFNVTSTWRRDSNLFSVPDSLMNPWRALEIFLCSVEVRICFIPGNSSSKSLCTPCLGLRVFRSHISLLQPKEIFSWMHKKVLKSSASTFAKAYKMINAGPKGSHYGRDKNGTFQTCVIDSLGFKNVCLTVSTSWTITMKLHANKCMQSDTNIHTQLYNYKVQDYHSRKWPVL